MDSALQLILMIEGPSERSEIVALIQATLPDVSPLKSNSCRFRDNLIEVWANPDADVTRESDPVEVYLYFAYRVEGTPLVDVSESNQVSTAKLLLSIFAGAGWKVVPCANFEDQL